VYIYIRDSLDMLSAQDKTDHRKSRIFLSGLTGIRNCKQSNRKHVYILVSVGGY